MSYDWDFGAVFRHSDLLWQGMVGTLQMTAVSLVMAVPFGLVLALLRLTSNRLISGLARFYIDFFRSSSQFVLIYWFFYAFPVLVNLNLDALAAGSLAIAAHFSAIFAEVFRAGIVSVQAGQWEAGKAVGLSRTTIFSNVILPQAFRRVLPVLFTHAIDLFKATSFVSAVSFTELSFSAAQIASETYRPIETYLVVGAIYFVAVFLASQSVRQLERRLARADR
ncbi:MAG TPA: amino acid ABC transporter permease [Beijerinckiaceae bacterium]|jgi:polar amino acid transport system permease protein|nr:amino acid ABC transporter permease [Beijerinckiaceae bacterium]